jgi:TMEM175 potassium channel family protein
MFEKNRLEAFSDGVLAIAVTLLALDLHSPAAIPRGLARALGAQWPSYAAYAVSFLVIGIIWLNHHAMFRDVRTVDRPVLFINLALLGVVSAIPFPTRLLADYLQEGEAGRIAAAVYGATMLAMSICFVLLWIALARQQARQMHRRLDVRQTVAVIRRFGLGLVVYTVAIGVAFISAYLALALHGALALYYSFDQLRT